jgi:ketol-acid reductoisomerase
MTDSSHESLSIAVIGYGSQGCALALNWQDAGFDVTVGLRSGSKSRARAMREGIAKVLSIPKAVAAADCVVFAFPDHEHGRVFSESIAPHLNASPTLLFLHGMSIHFEFLTPPRDADVILLAPHGPGNAVRENALSWGAMSAFVSVFQDASGEAEKKLHTLALSAGFKMKHLVGTTFEHEAFGDMFGEQVVLCGGLAALIKNGFEVLVEDGIDPDHAYLEVAYQLDLIVDLIKEHGIEGMLKRISVAARTGSLESGPKVIDEATKARMKEILGEIKSGRFSKKLESLSADDLERIDTKLSTLSHPDLEKAARRFSR